MSAMERAEADIAAGQLWLARQRLSSYLVERADDDVIARLADVHLAMGDLPAAGALCFVLARDDEVARSAIAAWRRQNGGPSEQWRSIPRAVRTSSRSAHMHQLKLEALANAAERDDRSLRSETPMSWGERIADAGCVLLFFTVAGVCLAIFGYGLVELLS